MPTLLKPLRERSIQELNGEIASRQRAMAQLAEEADAREAGGFATMPRESNPATLIQGHNQAIWVLTREKQRRTGVRCPTDLRTPRPDQRPFKRFAPIS